MKKTVYVVEDNDDIREMIEYLLSAEDYEVSGYATAFAFKEKLKITHPDVIVLDVMLPDGNGLEICDQLKSNQPTRKIPILLMSAHAQVAKVNQSCKAEDFISKPFDIDDFIRRVNKYAKP